MNTSTPLILLDTKLRVHYVRQSPLYVPIEAKYGLVQRNPPPVIRIVTRGEILALAEQFGWGNTRCEELERLTSSCLIINLNYPGLVEAYSEMDAYSIRIGRKIGQNDFWIAATARVTGAHLLTTDKDFDHLHPTLIQRDWIDPQQK